MISSARPAPGRDRARPAAPVEDAVPFGLGAGDGGRRGVPRRVPEFPAPQHVIPVRVGRPADRGPQPSRQLGGQSGQVGRCHGRVDDQAAPEEPTTTVLVVIA